MEISKFQQRVTDVGKVFIKDTSYDVAIRAVMKNGELKAYLKHKGRNEVAVPQDHETFCDVLIGGIEINEKEYERY